MNRLWIWLTLTLLLFTTVTSISVLAGGMEAGGGKSVVCRKPDHSIRTAEILDLYEGRALYQLTYHESPEDWKTQARAALPDHGDFPNQWLETVISKLHFLPKGTKLVPIADSQEAIAPESCSVEQTVSYMNDQLILVDREIWETLSNTNKAALMVHEAVYRYMRDWGEKDSRRARHFTAYRMGGGTVSKPELKPYFPCVTSELNCSRLGVSIPVSFIAGIPFFGPYVSYMRHVSPNLVVGGELGFLLHLNIGGASGNFSLILPAMGTLLYELPIPDSPQFTPFAGLGLGIGLITGAERPFDSVKRMRGAVELLGQGHLGAKIGREQKLFVDIRLGTLSSEFIFAPTIGWFF